MRAYKDLWTGRDPYKYTIQCCIERNSHWTPGTFLKQEMRTWIKVIWRLFSLILEYIFYDFFSLSVKSCPPPANWQKWEAAVALSSFWGRPWSLGYVSHPNLGSSVEHRTLTERAAPNPLLQEDPSQRLKSSGAEDKDEIKSKCKCHMNISGHQESRVRDQ